MKGLFNIKRYLSFFIALLMLTASCSIKEKQPPEPDNDEGELIIRDSNSNFRFAAEEPEGFLPTEKISPSFAETLELIYEPMFDFDEELNPIPVLAESCTAVSPTQYRVTLKQGVKWHDGTDFNANDVIYTFNALKGSESVFAANVKKMTQADFVSRTKVLFTLSEPTSNFVGLLSFPIIKRNTPSGEKSFSPNGTGPYKFAEKKNNTYFFDKNEAWHGGDASDKRISITLMKDKESAVYAFEANEADVISSKLMDLSKNTPRGQVSVQNYTSNNLTFLGMNDTEGILSVPEIRCAISYLIDKQAIIDNDVYGRGEAAELPVYPRAWFCNTSGDKLEVKADASYLEGLLNENGWFMESGIFVKDFGKYKSELTLSVLVNSESSEKTAIAKSIAQTLGQSGIAVKIKAVPYEQYVGRIRSMDYSMFIGEIAMDKNMDPSGLVKSGANYFGYSSREMDDALSNMCRGGTNEELSAGYSEFAGVFMREMPFVPLFFRKEAMISTAALAGFGMPNYCKTYRNVENWYISQKVELKD